MELWEAHPMRRLGASASHQRRCFPGGREGFRVGEAGRWRWRRAFLCLASLAE